MAFSFRGILFDWAFTLVDLADEDPRPAFVDLFEFLRHRGIATPDFDEAFHRTQEMFYEMIALSRETHREACFEQVLKYFLLAYGIDLAGKTTLAELLTVYYKTLYGPRKPYADTVATLAQLKSLGVRMGVVSNTTNPGFVKAMECSALGLDGFFEFFVYSSEVPFRKPHPSIFRLALQRWQFRPEEVLYVGDDLKYDVEGAGRVGMRTAWVNRKGRGRVEGIRPDYEISSLLEILALDNCGERSD